MFREWVVTGGAGGSTPCSYIRITRLGETKNEKTIWFPPVSLFPRLARSHGLFAPTPSNAWLHVMETTCKRATQTSNVIGGSVGRSPLSTMNLYGVLACILAPELL